MELFTTDRERLAFLLDTDAALDPDFEVLEALASGEDGILANLISVNYQLCLQLASCSLISSARALKSSRSFSRRRK